MLYYYALHRRMELMYDPCCTHEHTALDIELFKAVKAAFKKAIAYLHGKKAFTPDDLNHKDVKPYITETYKVLSKAVQIGIKYEIPAVMMNKLDKDVFLFSGMKVFNALKEGELTLRDKDGHVKSWEQFRDDAKKINSRYNENYLRAERRYAIDAAHAASEWEIFYQDKDIFDLEYLTDNGPNVRDSHRAMEHTVLPMDDPFWKQYFPPNGWNCHCFTVRVPKGDKPHSNSIEAITKGDANTTTLDKAGNNSAAIFRFNAGQKQIIFPEKHPYYPQYCNGAKLNVSRLIGYAQWLLDAEGDRCMAKKVVERMAMTNNNFNSVEERKWGKENLQGKIFDIESIGKTTITGKGIAEFTNQPFKFPKLKTYIWRNMEDSLNNAKYIGVNEFKKGVKSHIFEVVKNKQMGWIIVHEYPKINIKRVYSISDSKKVKKGAKK